MRRDLTDLRSAGRVSRRGALAGLLTLTAAACSSGAGAGAGGAPARTAGFPLELTNCQAQLRFDVPPERLVLLESAPVTTLDALGVLDRVVARAGSFPPGYYDDDLAARIEAIPALSEDLDASGHLQISQEVVIAQRPDLVFGLPDGVTREGLRAADADVLVQDVYCGTAGEPASFDALHALVDIYGQIFARTAEADDLNAALSDRITAVATAAAELTVSTAAVLYPSVGGGPLYTYGAGSMATAQLDALGIENVFADTPDRVFELGAESLLARDPDVLIVLYQGDGDGSAVAAQVLGDQQLAGMRAVRTQALLPLLFNFAEPASPLVVDGLEQIHGWLAEQDGARG